MAQGPSDAVRAYQLPDTAPGERANQPLTSNLPISITPGFGSSGAGQLPPIMTGQAHLDETVTSYCSQAKNEKKKSGGGGGGGGGNDFPAEGRNAHVKRVFALEGGGDARKKGRGAGDQNARLTDTWFDMLRIDHLPVAFWGDSYGSNAQQIDFVVHWNDDPNNPEDTIDDSNADIQYENANAARTTHQLEVKNPAVSQRDLEDGDDNQLWLIDETGTQVSQSDIYSGRQGQEVIFTFHNDQRGTEGVGDEDVADREVRVVKVYNNDLAGFEMSREDGTHPKIVPYEDYLKQLQQGKKDTSQYIDYELTIRYFHSFQTEEQRGGVQGQMIAMSLAENQEIYENYFDNGDPKAVDVDGTPSVVRTDPLQSIVNLSWGGLAVIFAPKDQDSPPFSPPKKMVLRIVEQEREHA
jgi:hypothetical protein